MKRGHLLDTNVVSETRKTRPNPGVIAFVKDHARHALFLSVLTMGELRKGAARCRTSDPTFAGQLSDWIDGLEGMFEGRILQVDLQIANTWGDLAAERTRPIIDTLLLATAVAHELTFVTRNTVDARGTEAHVLNPFV